jgi:hypothetical protein
MKCVRISENEGNKVKDSVDIEKWMCKSCVDVPVENVGVSNTNIGCTDSELVKHLVNDLKKANEKIVNLLEELCVVMAVSASQKTEIVFLREKVENKTTSKLAFADVVKRKVNTPPSISKAVLVIQQKNPVDGSTNQDLFSSVKKKVMTSEHNKADINDIKQTKLGKIIIECANDAAKITLKENLQNSMGNNFEVREPNRFSAKIKLCYVPYDEIGNKNNEEIVEIIKNDNELGDDLYIKILRVGAQNYTGDCNIIMEVDENSKNLLLKKERLRVGYKLCYVEEHVNITTCHKCQKFGHVQKDCWSKNEVCSYCAGNHRYINCKSQRKNCSNCIQANEMHHGLQLPVNHTAYDKNCEVYQQKVKDIKKRYENK